MKVSLILDFFNHGPIALSEFQRRYVRIRGQFGSLMQPLHRRYPVGSLLVWTTWPDKAVTRGDKPLAPRAMKLLLDGQQRSTTPYGIMRGRPPRLSQVSANPSPEFFSDLNSFRRYASGRLAA